MLPPIFRLLFPTGPCIFTILFVPILADFAAADPPPGFVSLLDGTNLTNWKELVDNPQPDANLSTEERAAAQVAADQRMRSHWKVTDGVLQFDGEGESIATKKDYADFELYVDWKIQPGGDSGIYLRGLPQVQIWDPGYEPLHKHGAEKGSGGLWNNQHHERFPLVKADKPIGKWNTFYIKMVGNRVTVKLNGELVVDDVELENYWEPDQPVPASGPIVLQNHGNRLWFRNLYVRELGSFQGNAAASGSLAISPHDKAIILFNGHNLDGFYTWLDDTHYDDPRHVFQVSDGMLHVTGDGYGGVITKEEYRDYHLILEYKWGQKTWKERKDNARDSGMLIHSTGVDGGFQGRWMPSIEVQIIEGGVGDFLLVPGADHSGKPVPLSLTSHVRRDRDGEVVWYPCGEEETFNLEHRRRVNWRGRDPNWEDVLGFRGSDDPDSPPGEWTRLDVRCEQDKIVVFVNGIKVNEAAEVHPSEGRLQLQTELAEIYVRRWELWPLEQAPIPDSPE